MSYQLIPQDATVTIYDGGVWNGTASPTFGSGSPLGIIVTYKSIKVNFKVNTISTRGAGDVHEYLRPSYDETGVVIEAMIGNTGILPITVGGYGKVTILPVSGGTLQTYIGLWGEQSMDISSDSPQMQTLTLTAQYDSV